MNWQLNRSGSSVSNFNQSTTRSLQASSTDVQVKQEVKVIDETLDPMGYLKESVSNINTTPDLNGEKHIGHAVILTNNVLPDEEDWSNSDMSSIVLVGEDDYLYIEGSDSFIPFKYSGQGCAHTTTVDLISDADKTSFHLLAEGEFNHFINSVDAKKTKETEKFGMGVFQAYLEAQGMDLETALADENLDEIIARFYPSARTKGGDYYSKNSIILIRFSLARFVMKLKHVDITNRSQFPKACMSFKATVKKLKREGKAKDTMSVSGHSAETAINSRTSIKGMAIAADTLCPQNDCSNTLSDDEDTAEEREERGIKRPFKRLTERHFPAVNKGRTLPGQPSKPQCIVCSNPAVKRHQTEFICKQCLLPMCPAPCFKRYHTMADYKTTCSDAYHMC